MLVERREAPRTKREHVNVDDVAQRRCWCRRMDCTELQLLDAASVVGLMAVDVRRHLLHLHQLGRTIEALGPTSNDLRRHFVN